MTVLFCSGCFSVLSGVDVALAAVKKSVSLSGAELDVYRYPVSHNFSCHWSSVDVLIVGAEAAVQLRCEASIRVD